MYLNEPRYGTARVCLCTIFAGTRESVPVRVTAAARPGSGTGVVPSLPPLPPPRRVLLVVLVVLASVVPVVVDDGDFLEVANAHRLPRYDECVMYPRSCRREARTLERPG